MPQAYISFALWIEPKSRKGIFSVNTEIEKRRIDIASEREADFHPTEDLTEDMVTWLVRSLLLFNLQVIVVLILQGNQRMQDVGAPHWARK